MNRKLALPHPPVLTVAGLAVTSAFWLKHWFATASVGDLLWILAPVAGLVHQVSGYEFVLYPEQGFVNIASATIIAPACSGINFLLITFLMLVVQGLMALKRWSLCLAWLLASAVFSFMVTVTVNGARILCSIWLYQHQIAYGLLTMERLHRLCGVVLYYSALLLIFYGAGSVLASIRQDDRKATRRVIALLPLFCYIAGTIVVPLLTRETFNTLFWEHCLVVAVVAGSLTVLLQGTPLATLRQHLFQRPQTRHDDNNDPHRRR